MADMEEFYKIYGSPQGHTVSFSKMKEVLTKEVLEELRNNKDFSLHRLSGKINLECMERHNFWQYLLQQRGSLSQENLFELWFLLISAPCRIDHQMIKVPVPKHIKPKIPPENPSKMFRFIHIKHELDERRKQLLLESSLTDELLIDNPAVAFRYSQVQKPGFEMLRCAWNRPRRTVRVRMPEKMRCAVEEDNVDAFLIYKDMTGMKLSYSLLSEIMENRATGIFDTMLKSKDFFKRTMPLEELAAYCTAQFEDSASVAFLRSMEKNTPGTVKNVRDAWGRNLLWYAACNVKTAYFHPNCKLVAFLLQNGCDADNCNRMGISWRDMMKNLTMEQKIILLKLRYRKNCRKGFFDMKKEQPLDMLKDQKVVPVWRKYL